MSSAGRMASARPTPQRSSTGVVTKACVAIPPTDDTARTMHMTKAICDGAQALFIATRVSYCNSRPVHTMPAVPMVIHRTSGMLNSCRKWLCWPVPRRLAGTRAA